MKRPLFFICLYLITAHLTVLSSAHGQQTVIHDSLVYRTVEDHQLITHRFQLKDRSAEPAPAIIFFFGGGWVRGHPRQFFQHSEYLAKQGMVAFSAEYRVQSRHDTTPFDAVEDGIAAIQWLREQAESLNIDPDRIVAAGGSAGGHVAACTGTLQSDRPGQPEHLAASLPNAMVLFNPVIDTGPEGYGYDRLQDRYKEISPVDHVTPQTPPTLIFHGTADSTVPFENVIAFQDSMKQAGNICEILAFEGKSHGFFNYGRDGNAAYERTIAKTDSFLTAIGILNK